MLVDYKSYFTISCSEATFGHSCKLATFRCYVTVYMHAGVTGILCRFNVAMAHPFAELVVLILIMYAHINNDTDNDNVCPFSSSL